MALTRLDGDSFRQFILAGNLALEQKRAEIDALNVFPVPDGDTGVNMYLTIKTAWQEAQNCPGNSLTAVAEAVSLGSLMGARGNSGVILSQLFRGFARGVEGQDSVDPQGLATALQEGVHTAYDAVMRPVEGTMLTVAREAGQAAHDTARRGGDIVGVLQAVVTEAAASLARTPDLLPVLKRAGVVDAGGKGLLCIFEAGLTALRDGTVFQPEQAEPAIQGAHLDGMEEVGENPYDSQLLLRGTNMDLERLRSDLEQLGDSLLVVGTPNLAKVHVHTQHPDAVLSRCLAWGEIDQVEILDMRQQHAEFAAGRKTEPAPAVIPLPVEPTPMTGDIAVVTVAMGDGLIDIFHSLGAAAVVPGGQTMNPSIEDILTAVDSVPADQVIVLPNNKNVIPAAQQAANVSARDVRVLPTRTIPQGLSALLALRPEATLDANVDCMTRALSQVRTGLVTFAVRDAVCENGAIQRGEILGLVEGQIEVSSPDRDQVAADLTAMLAIDDTEIITIFHGEGVTEDEARSLGERISAEHPDHEVEVRYGGQPHYFYIISVE